MKRKPKETLSPLQRTQLTRIIMALALLAVLWLLFAPNMGIMSLRREHNRLEDLELRKRNLEQENAALLEEIEHLENDIEYFERIAREKYGLLKKNEVIFDFSKEEKKNE